MRDRLFDRHGYETDFALRVRYQEERRFAAFALQGVDPAGDVGRARDRLLAHFDKSLRCTISVANGGAADMAGGPAVTNCNANDPSATCVA